jgi:HSP20 family protein
MSHCVLLFYENGHCRPLENRNGYPYFRIDRPGRGPEASFQTAIGGNEMFQSMFQNDIFSELNELHRLQQEMRRAFDIGAGTGIRGNGVANYPMLNVGKTDQSVELYAFAPGLDPASIDVNLERGVLSIAAERGSDLPARDEKATVHINERYAGRFRRVLSMPDDVDPNNVSAQYKDGVLHIQLKRRESAQARRIAVQ